MNGYEIAAIAGAAAWIPQIVSWITQAATRPKISLYPHSRPQIGYNFGGPFFNISIALLSENKDAVLNRFTVMLRHEDGASYTFEWVGLSEALSEIENPVGPSLSVKKSYLPLVVKVLHTGAAQAFVSFQHGRFKLNAERPYATVLEEYHLARKAGKLVKPEDIKEWMSSKALTDVLRLVDSEFIWQVGKYVATFNLSSPNKVAYKKSEYTFELSSDDVEHLRRNIGHIRDHIADLALKDIQPDFELKQPQWESRYPELKKKEPLVIPVRSN